MFKSAVAGIQVYHRLKKLSWMQERFAKTVTSLFTLLTVLADGRVL
jgi:hypothetical protein